MAKKRLPDVKFINIGIFLLLLSVSPNPLYAQFRDSVLLPVKNLRISFHIFQDDNGHGNFQEDQPGQLDFLKQIIGWANQRLANLDTLKPVVTSPFVADCRVHIRLDTFFFHRDTRAWDCSAEIDSPYMRERYVDGDTSLSYKQKFQTLPIFIGANNQVTGGHTRNIGDRGYIAVRGYFENFKRQPDSLAIDECGRNLIHELGHCLGLGHNFTGGPGGEQCDNCNDNGCPLEGTSNNIMDYWPSYGYALSLCQFNWVHFCLSGGMGNISEVVINDSCYRNPMISDQVLSRDTLFIRDTVYMHNHLIIKDGGVLVVSGYLSMPGETGITLEAGGRLVIDGGAIGNLCGDLWLGIRVVDATGNVPAMLIITRGGKVENAITGIQAMGKVVAELNNSIFSNCTESIDLLPGSADSILISNSRFSITTKLNHYEDGIVPGFFIRSTGVPFIKVVGTVFINEPGSYVFDADFMGTGINTDAPGIVVERCEFQNLTTGIDLNSQNPEAVADVYDNRFIHNRFGIVSSWQGLQRFSKNRLILQRFNSGNTIGIMLWNPDRFVVKENSFESVYGGGRMAGIVLNHASTENSPVFGNNFSNLPIGVFMDGNPDIDEGLLQWAQDGGGDSDQLKLGPQFRNNQFDTVALHLAIVTDSVCGMATGSPDIVGAEYFIPASQWSTGAFAWYSEKVNVVAFDGWKPLKSGNPDHGFYWFMNYQGLTELSQQEQKGHDYLELAKYLLNYKSLMDSTDLFFDTDYYRSILRFSEVPAALRSPTLAEYWNKYRAEDQPWLREGLAAIAGRFTREDSLLSEMGTELAKKNMEKWREFNSTGFGMNQVRMNQVFEFPDLSAFRFVRPFQERSDTIAFLVYPNPAENYILVQPKEGHSLNKNWQGKIFSADGRFSIKVLINSWNEQKLNIGSLSSGVYFIELFSGIQYLGTAKFVKITKR